MNFYFKGGNIGVGCEFLHKSFREYLFAEAIVAELLEIGRGRSGPLESLDRDYWEDFPLSTPQYRCSRTLGRLLSPYWLTDEVRTHVDWLLKQEIKAAPERWVWIRDLLLDVYTWWADGAILRPQPKYERGIRRWHSPHLLELIEHALPFDPDDLGHPIRANALDAHLGEALIQITAIVHAELADFPRQPDPLNSQRIKFRRIEKKVSFAPGGGGFLDYTWARINAGRWRPHGQFPSRAKLPGLDLTRMNIPTHGPDVRTTLSGGKVLLHTNLHFRGADLTSADMAGADLSEYHFSDATLKKADLSKSIIKGAVFEGADLRDAILVGANLTGANFERANLTGADLTGANLTNARLRGARLDRANLTSTILSGADLRETILEAIHAAGEPIRPLD